MTKLTNLEGEINQLKTDSNERMDRLELTMDNLRLEADKRHSELTALLMARVKSPPPLPPPPSEPPPSSTIPSSTLGPPFFSRPSQPLPHVIPYTIPLTLPQSIPPTWGFDSSELPPHPFLDDSAAIHTSNLYSAPHIPPSSHGPVSFVDTGQFASDNGIGRGPGPPGDRPWISGVDYRMRKLKMPIFDGTDAFGWIYRLERYFDIQGFVTTGKKLRAAALCMEGQALAWYRWTDGRTPFRHWEGLKHQLFERFQPSHADDIHEQFLAIRQEGSVRDYIGVFETLTAQLPRRSWKGHLLKG